MSDHLNMAQNVVVPPFDVAPKTVVGSTPQSEFYFDFPFWEKEDVLVLVNDVQRHHSTYEVEGYPVQNSTVVEGGYGSGKVILNAPVSNVAVTVDRFVVGARHTQFSRSAPLPAATVNADLNKVTARQQDLRRSMVNIQASGVDRVALAQLVDNAMEFKQDSLYRPNPAIADYRAVVDKLRESISLQDATGYDPTGAVDMSPIVEYLIETFRSEKGGEVLLPAGPVKLSSLHIPPGVTLRGARVRQGEESAERNYGRYGTVIWLDPDGDFTMGNMAQIEDVAILNPKVRFVRVIDGVPDLTEAQAMGTATIPGWPHNGGFGGVAQFSGTAIKVVGDDVRIKNCLIIGFNKMMEATTYDEPMPGLPPGPSRLHMERVWWDCTNGWDLSDCWDVPTLDNIHGWNFFTGHTGYSWDAVERQGIAYNLHDKVDGTKISRNFALGWKTTFRFKDIFACTVVECGVDGVPVEYQNPDFIGILTEGTCNALDFVATRVDGVHSPIVFNHTEGGVTGSLSTGLCAGKALTLGPGSRGALSQFNLAASHGGRIKVKAGVGEWGFGQIFGWYMIPNGIGANLFEFDDLADRKKIQRGAAIMDDWSHVNDVYGPSYRSLLAGSHLDNQLRLIGSPAASTGLPAAGFVRMHALGDDANIGIDIDAKGRGAKSQVRLFRTASDGTRELLGRFGGPADATSSNFFINSGAGQVDFAVEGAGANINATLTPKGAGMVVLNGPSYFNNGMAANNPLSPGGITFEYFSNTALRVKMKGSDGVVRFATLTLAP